MALTEQQANAIRQFEQLAAQLGSENKAGKMLKEQHRALDSIVSVIKSGWDNAPEEILQMMLEDI